MIGRIAPVLFLLLFASQTTGCTVLPFIPPVIEASYHGFTKWKGDEAIKYYAYDLYTVSQAVLKTCDQLKLEKKIYVQEPEEGLSLELKGNNPMKIKVLPVESSVTRIVISSVKDKQYAEFFLKTVDDNLPKKKGGKPLARSGFWKKQIEGSAYGNWPGLQSK